MITGDKNRDLLQEMLNLPPPAAKKPQATAAAIKPGVSGGGASRKGGFVQDALPEGLMLAEGPAQTGGRISESEGAIVPAGLAGGGLVPFDEEGAGGDEEEEPDLTGMRDDVPEDALDAQPGVMQVILALGTLHPAS